MAKILKESDMRELESQLAQGKITYGRMVELIEEKVLQGCIPKVDLLAQLETASQAMKDIAYNEDLELSERHQAYNRFAALQWLKDWIPQIVNESNAENGNIEPSKEPLSPTQERLIAVITPYYQDFEVYVRDIYKSMSGKKSIQKTGEFTYITIEGKCYKSKYFHVDSIEKASGRTFDSIEKGHRFGLMKNGDELLHFCYSRLKDKNARKPYNYPAIMLMPETKEAICNSCGHAWKIELPAIYKETFCLNCGE